MIKIGEIIQKLRKSKGLTQEQISDVLGVSIAAVSKWETGTAYPDITLLPNIAKFFNVSVDYLLDYKINVYDQVEEIIKKSESLYSQGKKLEVIQLLTENILKFPNEVKLKFILGRFKTYIGCNLKSEDKVKMLEEAIELFDDVIKLTNERSNVDEAYNLMSNCYLFLGKGEKALDIINNIRTSKKVNPEAIVANILYTLGKVNEGNLKSQENLFNSLTDILTNISNFTWNNQDDSILCLEYLDLQEKIITVFSKEQCSFLSLDLSYCYEFKAFLYCKINNFEMALNYLRKAITLTTLIDSNPNYLKNKHFFNLVEIELQNTNVIHKNKLKQVIFSEERKDYNKLYDLDEFKDIIRLLES